MKRVLLFSFFLMASLLACANNVQVSSVTLMGSHKLKFTIGWEHSWRLEGIEAPYNHDAVWVFVKYRAADGGWQHLDIDSQASSHFAGAGLKIEGASDGKGVFISRSDTGSGTISPTQITLQWSWHLPAGNYEFKVCAIEMVWVNEEGFYVGDAKSQFRFRRGDTDAPFYIDSGKEITIGKDSLSLSDTGKYAPAQNIPAEYPKGYGGFYCMKYEITQEQYADFLNSLTYAQQQLRTAVSPSSQAGTYVMTGSFSNRNGIVIATPGQSPNTPAIYACNGTSNTSFDAVDDGQNHAMNFLSWMDLAAYLDWAALRPMTEFEFEKICRGPAYPLKWEFAWGTDKVTDANTLVSDGQPNETISDILNPGSGFGSHGYNGPQGPIRVGFAGSDTSDRLRIGGSYYGALEMSGNVWEACVTVDAAGLKYTGENGDGNLADNGEGNVINWPGTDAKGAGYRGGGWNSGILPEFRDLAVSDRFYAGQLATPRRPTSGGRGVRSL
jgi:formylglycine-generating enzyme required for sulfatase activity